MANIFDLFKRIEHKSAVAETAPGWIIVGLGNPGREYEITRHNVGFLALDALAAHAGASATRARFSALVGDAVISDTRVLLMKPQLYMNRSGEAVSEAARFYKIAPDHILVLFDDICLDPGHLRVRRKGSNGGHRGVGDIIEHLGSDAFPRIKIGVGAKPHPEMNLADHVLSKLPDGELAAVRARFPDLISAVEKILAGDIDGAMGAVNG